MVVTTVRIAENRGKNKSLEELLRYVPNPVFLIPRENTMSFSEETAKLLLTKLPYMNYIFECDVRCTGNMISKSEGLIKNLYSDSINGLLYRVSLFIKETIREIAGMGIIFGGRELTDDILYILLTLKYRFRDTDPDLCCKVCRFLDSRAHFTAVQRFADMLEYKFPEDTIGVDKYVIKFLSYGEGTEQIYEGKTLDYVVAAPDNFYAYVVEYLRNFDFHALGDFSIRTKNFLRYVEEIGETKIDILPVRFSHSIHFVFAAVLNAISKGRNTYFVLVDEDEHLPDLIRLFSIILSNVDIKVFGNKKQPDGSPLTRAYLCDVASKEIIYMHIYTLEILSVAILPQGSTVKRAVSESSYDTNYF